MQSGDTSAEIELVKLYLTGTGVSKSCLQARVLLDAARSHDGALVQQNLEDDFPKYGCN